MKKLSMLLMLLSVITMGSRRVFAQSVTVTLLPGYTWISYPGTDTLDFATAMGSFVPMSGDVIQSQWGNSRYVNGQWRGNSSQFYPGYGYMYKSNRTMPVIVTFSTQQHTSQVIVTTADPTDITSTSALGGGAVTTSDETYIVEKGICWSINSNPTLDDNSLEVGNGTGSFTALMTGLIPDTTYYVRAFAVTTEELVYGEQKSFTTLGGGGGNPQTGAINGLFTINEEGDQVCFSQGNLQYQASTNTWRFAENQWDYVGADNSNISSEYEGWIDLFGWGTSGYHNIYDNFNVNYQPYSDNAATVQTECNYYGYGPSTNMYDPNLTGMSAEYDWGVHNAISNGGNQVGLWRTLTKEEWNYLFNTRSASTVGNTSNARFAKATVNGVYGVILFPDDFSVPIYLPTPLQINNAYASFNSNSYSEAGWAAMENLGCVFLPTTGYRTNYNSGYTCTYIYDTNSQGYYWSTTSYNSQQAYYVYFHSNGLNPICNQYYTYRYTGMSVRLVRNAE